MTVHHQFTFSSFTPGRKNIFDNFVNPHSVENNATEAQIIQAHSDWEQFRTFPFYIAFQSSQVKADDKMVYLVIEAKIPIHVHDS